VDRIGGFSLGILINSADTVNTQGVELEVSWLLSDQWTISFAGSYANPTVDQWDTNFCDDDDGTEDPLQLYCPLSDGSRLNDDPKFTSSTQVNYRRPLGVSNMIFFSHLSYAFQGESGGDDDSSSGTLNMNVGIDVDNWSVKLWSKNLLDDKSFGDRTSESEVVDNFYLSRNKRPRTLGITAIYRFGGE
jgi:outer membrane receptor protein involved in Fe transport